MVSLPKKNLQISKVSEDSTFLQLLELKTSFKRQTVEVMHCFTLSAEEE